MTTKECSSCKTFNPVYASFCRKCGHRYIPTYQAVVNAMHAGRTRYMKCPHCGQKSWSKKVINKTEE